MCTEPGFCVVAGIISAAAYAHELKLNYTTLHDWRDRRTSKTTTELCWSNGRTVTFAGLQDPAI